MFTIKLDGCCSGGGRRLERINAEWYEKYAPKVGGSHRRTTVTFSETVTVFTFRPRCVSPGADARTWSQTVADAERFRSRVALIGATISWVLTTEHRSAVYTDRFDRRPPLTSSVKLDDQCKGNNGQDMDAYDRLTKFKEPLAADENLAIPCAKRIGSIGDRMYVISEDGKYLIAYDISTRVFKSTFSVNESFVVRDETGDAIPVFRGSGSIEDAALYTDGRLYVAAYHTALDASKGTFYTWFTVDGELQNLRYVTVPRHWHAELTTTAGENHLEPVRFGLKYDNRLIMTRLSNRTEAVYTPFEPIAGDHYVFFDARQFLSHYFNPKNGNASDYLKEYEANVKPKDDSEFVLSTRRQPKTSDEYVVDGEKRPFIEKIATRLGWTYYVSSDAASIDRYDARTKTIDASYTPRIKNVNGKIQAAFIPSFDDRVFVASYFTVEGKTFYRWTSLDRDFNDQVRLVMPSSFDDLVSAEGNGRLEPIRFLERDGHVIVVRERNRREAVQSSSFTGLEGFSGYYFVDAELFYCGFDAYSKTRSPNPVVRH